MPRWLIFSLQKHKNKSNTNSTETSIVELFIYANDSMLKTPFSSSTPHHLTIRIIYPRIALFFLNSLKVLLQEERRSLKQEDKEDAYEQY